MPDRVIGTTVVQCPRCGGDVEVRTVVVDSPEAAARNELHVRPEYTHTCSLQGVPGNPEHPGTAPRDAGPHG